MLPRWRQAFAQATAVGVAHLLEPLKPEFVWLRLQAGYLVARQIEDLRPYIGDVAVVVLSDTPNDEEGMAAFSGSARGYCNSHASPEVLRQVAAVVSQGGLWIGESLMERLLVGMHHAAPKTLAKINGWEGKLTMREWEVAHIISSGASNKEVARQLGITERTVKAHVGVIFTKLEVHDRLHLALRIRETHVS